jgi:hypothetical protein
MIVEMSCNKCILDLCSIDICGNAGILKLPYTISVPGDYTASLDFQGVKLQSTVTFEIGETLQFNLTNLNENYCYTGEILDPLGARVLIDSAGTLYGGFSFCTNQIRIPFN